MAETDEASSVTKQVLLSVLAIILSFYLFFAYAWKLKIKPKIPLDVQKFLIITAHPDDECMFFSPTIQCLVAEGNFVHLLCLSTGDFYGLGWKRTKEIISSSQVLGIPESRVHIHDDSALPDSPVVEWSVEKVENTILPVIYYLQPHAVITFDGQGVSGHPNHIAIARALQSLCEKNKLPRIIRAFKLESCHLLRKYTSVLDLPFSWMTSDHMAVASPGGLLKGWRAMFAHRSQMEWFRYLYIIFSRYMLINTLQEICHQGDC